MDAASEKHTTDLARIRGIVDRCMRRAEESLQSLLGPSVRLALRGVHAPSLSVLPIPAKVAEGTATAGLQLQITGEGGGRILILLPMPMAFRFLETLLGGPAESCSLTEMERSAIQEVGNILASSFLSELGDLLGRRLLHSTPEIQLDGIPELVRGLADSLHASDAETLVVQGMIEVAGVAAQGSVFVVPEVATLEPVAHDAVKGREGSG